MELNTLAHYLPLLELLHQPALLLSDSGTLFANALARDLAPTKASTLPHWFGVCWDAYCSWDRRGELLLTLSLNGAEYQLTAYALADGTLLLLSRRSTCDSDVLAVVSQVLRQPLTDLSALSQQLSDMVCDSEDPGLWEQAAAMNRHIYRLTRITSNLADLERLRSGQYVPRIDGLDLLQHLGQLLTECAAVCRDGGWTLSYHLPEQSITLWADPMLLERALLNLISNAMKYGDSSYPITVRCDVTPHAVLFRVHNRCVERDIDLLHTAFYRLQERGSMPDPRWGLGLGLPLARAVAQLHGGTAAMEQDQDGSITVTLSFSRSNTGAGRLESPPFDYTGGMRRSLLELCESLPTKCFRVDSI